MQVNVIELIQETINDEGHAWVDIETDDGKTLTIRVDTVDGKFQAPYVAVRDESQNVVMDYVLRGIERAAV